MTDFEPKIEKFASAAESALGANLASLVLYGSAARAQHIEGRSDLNLMILVKDASTGALRPAAGFLGDWLRSGNSPPLLFSEAEWRASADVFPLEIEDMRDAHRVLRGRDPLDGMVTDRASLRQQLEREVRGKLLHLRTEYAAIAKDPAALSRLLENSLSTFLVFFRATLRLKGMTPPGDSLELIRETCKATGVPALPFEWALAARMNRAPNALRDFDPLAGQYVDAVERLAHVVNSL